MSSREKMKEKEPIRENSSWSVGEENAVDRASIRTMASKPYMLTEQAIEEGTIAHTTRPSLRTTRNHIKSADASGLPPETYTTTPESLHGNIIPPRESSLRHSYSGSPAAKKRRSKGHQRYSSTGSKVAIAEDKPQVKEEDVVKRIEELKAKKIERETVEHEAVQLSRRSRSPLHRSTTEPASLQAELPTLASTAVSVQVPESVTIDEGVLEDDDSAPAPAVPRRTPRAPFLRTNVMPRSFSTPNTNSTFPTVKDPPRPSVRRSGSLLKRTSRPTSPTSAEQQRASSVISPGLKSPASAEGYRSSTPDSIEDAVDDYINSPKLSQKVAHPTTGRVISFSEVGDPEGFAVICCVGMGLTRYLTAFYDELATTLKLRIITPDRPGVGESEPCLDGSGIPLNWPGKLFSIVAAE